MGPAASGASIDSGFARFLEAVPDAIICVDGDGAILLINTQGTRLFGYRRDELLGKSVQLLVPSGVRERHNRHRASYFQHPVTRPMGAGMELAGRRKDGSEFPAEISLASIELDGRLIVSAAIRDVTERKRAEAKFRGLLEAAPDAIVGVSPNGLIALVNTQAEALFGYGRGDLIGQPVELLVPDSARHIHPQHRTRYFADPQTRPMGAGMALAGRRRDGSEFPAEISLSSIETEDGLLVSAAIRDVTDRVEAQRERDRLEAQHEHDRLERQLHQSQRLESLGQLAGGVAHDFNNLLAAILNYVNFAADELTRQINHQGPADTAQLTGVLRDVRQIGAAGERAARLTHQLLAFGRREVIKPEVLDLNAIVGEVESLLRHTIGEHVTLVTQCAGDLEPVRADRGQIEQVLLNLAVNARDAMEGGGTLTIETCNVSLDDEYVVRLPDMNSGPHVRLRVSDTGAGMEPATLARAFEPFFTTKPKEKGSGLGLATVYGIVAQAGGGVNLYSEPGIGTTVTIMLPSVASPITAHDAAPLAAHHHGGETILVVEDDDLVRDVASRILTRHGYTVLVAHGGAEALALLEERGFGVDLLLTDVVMPGMTGNEVAARVEERYPGARVLYMSGYPESMVTSQGVVDAGVRLISKPFVEPELLETVRSVLDA